MRGLRARFAYLVVVKIKEVEVDETLEIRNFLNALICQIQLFAVFFVFGVIHRQVRVRSTDHCVARRRNHCRRAGVRHCDL